MFLLAWECAIIAIGIVIFLLAYVLYKKPGKYSFLSLTLTFLLAPCVHKEVCMNCAL